jgi:hypothetical protein
MQGFPDDVDFQAIINRAINPDMLQMPEKVVSADSWEEKSAHSFYAESDLYDPRFANITV